MATIKELSDGGGDGTRLGQSTTDLVSFLGATPIAQQSGSAQAAITTAAPTSVAVGAYAFSQAQATAILAGLNEWRRVLVAFGLAKGSI